MAFCVSKKFALDKICRGREDEAPIHSEQDTYGDLRFEHTTVYLIIPIQTL